MVQSWTADVHSVRPPPTLHRLPGGMRSSRVRSEIRRIVPKSWSPSLPACLHVARLGGKTRSFLIYLTGPLPVSAAPRALFPVCCGGIRSGIFHLELQTDVQWAGGELWDGEVLFWSPWWPSLWRRPPQPPFCGTRMSNLWFGDLHLLAPIIRVQCWLILSMMNTDWFQIKDEQLWFLWQKINQRN